MRAPWTLLGPGGAPAEQVAGLSVSERRALARFGTRAVRDVLIADVDETVMLEVVNNPRVTTAELQAWAERPDLSASTLRALSDSPAVRARLAVRAALEAHPRLVSPAAPPTGET